MVPENMEGGREKSLPFWIIFCPLHLNNPKTQNFEKMKKTPGDIIILKHVHFNDNHEMYGF